MAKLSAKPRNLNFKIMNDKKSQTKKEEEIIQEETEVTPSELDNVKMQLARALADYENLRKRVDRERSEMIDMITKRFITRFLPIFDMIADAQRHLGDAGLGISLKVLQDTLKDEGIVEIEVKSGMIFDHTVCEAVDTIVSEEHDEDTIAEVTLPGYKFIDGPVIRYAKVKVYKKN
jgi:molecular chaperone GrpE